jgi:hypothetical protein
MMALVLDSGALNAVDRNDRAMIARLRVAQRAGIDLRTHAMVVEQVWRRSARQANLSRVLKAVEVRGIDEKLGRATGELLGAARLSDAIDADLVLVAESSDRIVTSDPDDIRRLTRAAGLSAVVVPC